MYQSWVDAARIKNGATEDIWAVDYTAHPLLDPDFATKGSRLLYLTRLNFRRTLRGLRDRRGVTALVVAIFMGPFISVWISLVAIKNTEAGIAQVLLGMVPIFVILPAWLVYRDRPSPLSLFGIAIAVGGGTLLFLR